ncbi:MAG: MFS transporter [Phycisphaerae bacterium]
MICPYVAGKSSADYRRPPLLAWYIAHWLASFMSSLTSNAVYFFAAYELHEPAETQLGMAAAGGLMYTIGALAGGRMVDRFGQRRLAAFMSLACIPICLFGAQAVLLHSLLIVFVFLLLLNLATALLWPAVESALTCCPGKLNLNKRMNIYNIDWSTTGFLAGAIVGSLAFWFSWAGVFFIATALSLIVWVIICCFTLPQSQMNAGHVADSPEEQERTKVVLALPKSKTLLRMAWLSNMLSYIACNTVVAIMPTITHKLDITLVVATALASVWTLTRIAGFLLTTLWTGWHYRVGWMMLSFAALLVGVITLLLSSSTPLFVVAQALFGVAAAMLYSGSLYYAMHLSHGSGVNAGIHEGVIGIGTVLGPGVAALSGPPDAVFPKAAALFIILALGGGIMTVMARRVKGLSKVYIQHDRNIQT